jgi:hypothetical protein
MYQSKPGFVGTDRFTYARSARSMQNTPYTVTIRFAVTVTP